MEAFQKDLVMAVLGVLLGIPVAHYYYKRAFRRRLSVYVLYQWTTDDDLLNVTRDHKARERALRINFGDEWANEYKLRHAISPKEELGIRAYCSRSRQRMYQCVSGQEIARLAEAEFLVVNESDRAISQLIAPLRLSWPAKVRLVNAQVTLRHSEEINVSLSSDRDNGTLLVDFQLLKGGEWFVVRVLADGDPRPSNWRWTIAADDIPRLIVHRHFSLDEGERTVPKTIGQITRGLLAPFLFMGAAIWLLHIGIAVDGQHPLDWMLGGIASVSLLVGIVLVLFLPRRYKKWKRSPKLVQAVYRMVLERRAAAMDEVAGKIKLATSNLYHSGQLLPYDDW